jgi:hypothetical protein
MRKIALYLISTIAIFNIAFSQSIPGGNKYIRITSEIMDSLRISKRNTTYLDGLITYKVSYTLDPMEALFNGHREYRFGVVSNENVYYNDPTIILGSLIDSILTKKISSSPEVYAIAESVFIHELCHYLQLLRTDSTYNNHPQSFIEHVKQNVELEAYSVGAYYYCKILDEKIFNIIMTSMESIEHKRKNLIEYHQFLRAGKIDFL